MAVENTVEVRRPKVTIKGESTDSVTYTATMPVSSGMDGCPSIRYSSHKAGGDRVESPTAKDLIQKIADAQKAMFEPPIAKDIVIYDGAGNAAVFTGYDTGPHHDIMFGGVNNGKNLVHRCARLFFINSSVYRPPPPKPGESTEEPTGAAIEILKGVANPCAALKLILQNIIKDFLATSGEATDTTDYKIRKKIHEANLKIIEEEWYPILNASTESAIPDFAAASENPTIQVKMYDSIRSVYLSGSADFSVIMSQFESMFQMKFVPGHMGITPGKFIPATAMLLEPKDKDVNIVSLSMNPGPKKFLVPTAVAVRGAPIQEEPPTAQAVQTAGSDMIVWPETIPEAGQTVVIQMPSWLPEDLFPLEIPKFGDVLDFNLNLTQVKAANADKADAGKIVSKICLAIARLAYNDISLASASASIVCPLDVTWEIGKRYNIKQPGTKSGESSPLFSGFLRNVQHRISSSPSKAEASTQLTFSHVEANGFTLPNK